MRQALREGESLNDDEITEVLKIAYDPDFESIQYDTWIHKLLVNNCASNNVLQCLVCTTSRVLQIILLVVYL